MKDRGWKERKNGYFKKRCIATKWEICDKLILECVIWKLVHVLDAANLDYKWGTIQNNGWIYGEFAIIVDVRNEWYVIWNSCIFWNMCCELYLPLLTVNSVPNVISDIKCLCLFGVKSLSMIQFLQTLLRFEQGFFI